MSSTKRGSVRAAHDLYETPRAAALPVMSELAALWAASPHHRPPLILDAGAGRGALVRAARTCGGFASAHIVVVELQDTIDGMPTDWLNRSAGADETILADFLTLPPGGYLDIAVSNPPFELAQEFVSRTLDVLRPRLAAFLLRLNYLGSQKRRDWWREHTPDALRVLGDRPRFDGPRECGGKACRVVWDRGPEQRACPSCGWRDGGDSIEYSWLLWSSDPMIKAALHERPIGWY